MEEAAIHKVSPKKTTKEAIIEEATNLFYEFGYGRTSIRDVTGRLNIPNPSIYYYFKNKEHLLFEVIESSGLDVINALETVINQVDDPLDKLANMVYRHLYLVIKKRKKHKVFIEEGYHLSGKLAERITFLNRKIYNLYYYQIKILGERDLLKTKECSVVTFMILGIINWAYRWFREDGRLSLEQLVDIIIISVFYGVVQGEMKAIKFLPIKEE